MAITSEELSKKLLNIVDGKYPYREIELISDISELLSKYHKKSFGITIEDIPPKMWERKQINFSIKEYIISYNDATIELIENQITVPAPKWSKGNNQYDWVNLGNIINYINSKTD
jgi:hypothetical protein